MLFRSITDIASSLGEINTVQGGLVVPTAWSSPVPDGNITTSATTDAFKVNSSVQYVVALANISKETGIAKTTFAVGKTFAEVNQVVTGLTIGNIANTTDGFLMTSAPSIKLEGTDYTGMNMTTCTTYSSAALATAGVANNVINLERMVSKVELIKSNTSTVISTSSTTAGWYKATSDDDANIIYLLSGNNAGDRVEILGWNLDITNKYTYPFRQMDVSGWYGTDGSSNPWKLINGTNRVYYAKDPNYDGTFQSTIANDFNALSNGAGITGALSPYSATPSTTGVPQYCLENTFNTDNQDRNQTTRVLIRAKYTPYVTTTNGNGVEADGTWYSLNNTSTKYNVALLTAKLVEYGKLESYSGSPFFASSVASTDVVVTLDGNNGSTAITGVSVNSVDWETAKVTAFNAKVSIVKYNEGYCYYGVRIRHFTDAELYNDTYVFDGSYDLGDLGRYGVVRNTSYRVMINTISQPGTPDIPSVPDQPDDDQIGRASCRERV